MKKLFILLLLITGFAGNVMAQEKDMSNFLFDEYQDALIFYKDGRQFAAPVNFDLLAGHFLFIDAKDKKAKQFANPGMVGFIQVNSRNFLLTEGEAVEILQLEPLFQVAYSGNSRQAPKNLTYGGTTQTASVDTYEGYSGNSLLNMQRQSNNRVIVGIDKNYKMKVGKKTKRFNNAKTFVKAFPKEQRDAVLQYVETQNIDFDNVQQVFELYKQATERFIKKIGTK